MIQCYVSFRGMAKWFSYTYIHSFSGSFHVKAATDCSVYLSVLYHRSLLANYFMYSSVCVHPKLLIYPSPHQHLFVFKTLQSMSSDTAKQEHNTVKQLYPKKKNFLIKSFLKIAKQENEKILWFKFRRTTFLVVQWLRLHHPMQGVQIWSLVGELRSHIPHGQKTKT